MCTGKNGTSNSIWQIWPCGKLYWDAFYEVAGEYRQALPDKTNQMKKRGMKNKRLHKNNTTTKENESL